MRRRPPQRARAGWLARVGILAAGLGALVAAAPTTAAPEGAAPHSAPAERPRELTGGTLRFDYYHSGTAHEEHVGFDRLRLEGAWPGSWTRLLDDTDLGKYRFVVRDASTHRVLYSRGFSSIYGEWETTGEARAGRWRTFPESQRFPEPRRSFQLLLEKRAADGTFRPLYASGAIDPSGRAIDRTPLVTVGPVHTVFAHGDPEEKVDLLVLGDGYPAAAREAFVADVERLVDELFAVEPFRRRRTSFNVRALAVPASERGITDPRAGQWRANPLGLSYDTFGSGRYVLTLDDRAVREAAASVPYDTLVVLFAGRKYGGGGIFNLYATFPSGSAFSPYLFVHEFGHSFAGLGDEYYTSQVSYEEFVAPGTEPWEPNLTALLDPAALKWQDLVDPSTPLPTPWEQDAYDELSYGYQRERQALRAAGAPEEALEELFSEVRRVTTELLAAEEHAGEVGAFSGAGYQAKGLYRPEVDCLMFTRNEVGFCAVCERAIEEVIDLYAD